MAAEEGQRVGDYEVLAQLGAGGMGRVYKVRNVISNREEAMKILLPDFASDPELAARFMSEIRTLATLEHPGIAQLRTAFQFQNQFVMVMEYVEGITLEKLAAQVRIPVGHALDYAGQVLAALSYAHSRGVTHRDIKPANMMITTHGLVKLMDFGIAKSKEDIQLTRPGTTMGSVYYMSPEQVRGDTVDSRSDLYSLGVTLYEILTGRKPFQADTSYSVLHAQLNNPPTPPIEVNPALPAELNAIVLKAMEKRPEDRFQTADDFRNALRDAARVAKAEAETPPIPVMARAVEAPSAPASPPNPAPVAATPQAAAPPPFTPVPPVPGPAPVASRNHRGLWIGLGAALALIALVAVGFLLPGILATHASQKNASPPPTPAVAQGAPAVTPAADTSTPATTAPATGAATPQAPASDNAAPSPASSQTPARSASANTSGRAARAGQRPPYAPTPAATAESTSLRSGATPATVPVTPAGPSPQELRNSRDRYSSLQARADAALSSLQQLRSQQQAQGLGLRGDIVAAMSRMQSDMSEAGRSLNQNDVTTAGDYMDRADRELTTLEKFLGR
jgi:serine/threonine-protein kinase